MSRAPAQYRRGLSVSDLDGTLLRPDATLSETTVRVVNAYIAGGGLFTYATARSLRSAVRVAAPLRLERPVITYGGSIVVGSGDRHNDLPMFANAAPAVRAAATQVIGPDTGGGVARWIAALPAPRRSGE